MIELHRIWNFWIAAWIPVYVAGVVSVRAEVVMNEIMYHPGSWDDRDEYVELLNLGDTVQDLGGWRLDGAVSFLFPEITLGPGGYWVVAADQARFSQQFPEVTAVSGDWSGSLRDQGEELVLLDAAGEVVDYVRFSDEGDWAVRRLGELDRFHRGWEWHAEHDGLGMSLELINPAMPNDIGQNWKSSLVAAGTPGAPNSVFSGDIAPIVEEWGNFPVVPHSDEPVRIVATLRDESPAGVAAALFWRVDGEPEFREDEMRDDGEHFDGLAGDGVFGVVLPPQPDLTVVEFFFRVEDEIGNARVLPRVIADESGRTANFLYQVDDSWDAAAEWEPGSLPVYRLVMRASERSELRDIGDANQTPAGEAFSNAEMNGTLVSRDGRGLQTRHLLGIRNRGSSSRNDPPNNFRLNIPHDRAWNDVVAVNLNFKGEENQVMGGILFQLAGLPAAESRAVMLLINGINPRGTGFYAAVEALDSRFVRNHFPEDSNGNLYRIREDDSTGEKGDLRYEGEDPDAYRNTYFKNTNEEEDDWSDLIALTDVIHNSTEADFPAAMAEVADLGQWMRFLAFNKLIGNREGGLPTGKGDDFGMYRGLEDPRFVLIPHDFDTLFTGVNTSVIDDYRRVPGLNRLLTHPETVILYYQALEDMMENFFTPERIEPLMEQVFGGIVEPSTLAGLKQFVHARREAIRQMVSRALVVEEAPEESGGFARTLGDPFSLAGVADPARTVSVQVGSVPADWSPVHGTWSLTLDPRTDGLFPGINRLPVRAYGGPEGTGPVVGETFIDIWYESGTQTEVSGIPGLFSGSEVADLRVSVRDGFLSGVPVLVRVELLDASGRVQRGVWDGSAMLTVVAGDASLDTDEITLRNGAGSALVAIDGTGDTRLRVDYRGLARTVEIGSLEEAPVVEVSGELSGAASTWSGVVHVTGDVVVPEGHTLTIDPGAMVLVSGTEEALSEAGTDIEVRGVLNAMGTKEAPITITAADPQAPWGWLFFDHAGDSLLREVVLTRAGHSPRSGHTQTGPAVNVQGSVVAFDRVSITDLAGKVMRADSAELHIQNAHLARAVMGPEINGTALNLIDSFIYEMRGRYQENGRPPDDNDGIYLHRQQAGQEIKVLSSVVAGTDDDGIDTLASDVTVEDVIVRNIGDKGVSIIEGNNLFNRLLVVDAAIGISAKVQSQKASQNQLQRVTIAARDIAVQARDKFGIPGADIRYSITNSVLQAPIVVDTDYDPEAIQIVDSQVRSAWEFGTGNHIGPAVFTDAAGGDYHLVPDWNAGGEPPPGYFEMARAAVSDEVVRWGNQSGPYLVTSDLVVPENMRLIVAPGTSVYFTAGTRMLVLGELAAEGSADHRIRFTGAPGADPVPDLPGLPEGPPRWRGIHFENTWSEANRIVHADIEFAQDSRGSIGIDHSHVTVEDITIRGTHLRMIYADSASAEIRHSRFPDMFGEDESPAALGLDNVSEHIKLVGGVAPHGRFVIADNQFGTNRGHNDVLDLDSGWRPGPIVEVLNNRFDGSGDELIDLGGDAYIAGNLFRHVAKDEDSSDRGYASAISSGDRGGKGHIVVTRNWFIDVDHAVNLKRESTAVFENNTVVGVHADFVDRFGNPNLGSVINLYVDEPLGTPGGGAWLANNILQSIPRIFGNADRPDDTISQLAFRNNLVDTHYQRPEIGNRGLGAFDLGTGNVLADPRVESDSEGRYQPGAGSPAHGAGSSGQDLGAGIEDRIYLAGEPPAITPLRHARLIVGGPGMVAFKYRLNDGPWSDPHSLGGGDLDQSVRTGRTAEIEFTELDDGAEYRVEVLGRDFAGRWQAEPTISRSWRVDNSLRRIRLNEVLAWNESAFPFGSGFPDAIEIFNAGAMPVDLGGMSLSDDPADPRRFVIPAETRLEAGGYLVLVSDPAASRESRLGFGLDRDGDAVYLFDRPEVGGLLVDSVVFGLQVPDVSIGRAEDSMNWQPNHPTLGAANRIQPTGDPARVRLNEWLTASQRAGQPDYIELHNTDVLPVALSGLVLSDRRDGGGRHLPFPELSFLAGGGYRALLADDRARLGAIHLPFKLNAFGGIIGLFRSDGKPIDLVYYGPQNSDVSMGIGPGGELPPIYFPHPSPAAGNLIPPFKQIRTVTTVLDWTYRWRFNQQGVDLGTEWKIPDYDATQPGWEEGIGLFYREESALPGPKSTPLEFTVPQQTTFYFRTSFEWTPESDEAHLQFSHIVDDGMVLYLNGEEVYRFNLNAGLAIDYSIFAATVGQADLTGPMSLPEEFLEPGLNRLAVELHQSSTSSGDAVFGLKLEEVIERREPVAPLIIHEILAVNQTQPTPSGLLLPWVEIWNPSAHEQSLDSFALESASHPGELARFPEGSAVAPQTYVVFPIGAPAVALGSGVAVNLDPRGDTLRLFALTENRVDRLVDSVSFGNLPRDASLGRTPDDAAQWALCKPTAGAINQTAELGDGQSVRLNEWLARPVSGEDWCEIYNADLRPVELSGWFLSDDPMRPERYRFPRHSFLGPGDFLQILTDNQPDLATWHAGFRLAGNGEALSLFDQYGHQIDSIQFGNQIVGQSEGRIPDGSDEIFSMVTPSPDAPNRLDSDGDGLPDSWENTYQLDPFNSLDASIDSDEDGLSNRQEFLAGTNPRNDNDRLALTIQRTSENSAQLEFHAKTERAYIIQFRPILESGPWISLEVIDPMPNEADVTIEAPMESTSTAYYRIIIP